MCVWAVEIPVVSVCVCVGSGDSSGECGCVCGWAVEIPVVSVGVCVGGPWRFQW